MKTKTRIKFYRLAYSGIPETSFFTAVGVLGVGSMIGGMALSMTGVALIAPMATIFGTTYINYKLFAKRAGGTINAGDDTISRENIKRLITSYLFLLASDVRGEKNTLQMSFLPNGNENNIKLYRKFFLKNMVLEEEIRGKPHGGALTKEEISEIEKTYPGLFKEVLGEFMDNGILEHVLFKTEHYYPLEKTKSDFIVKVVEEFYPDYKMEYSKINNFSHAKNIKKFDAEKLKKFIPFINRNNDDLIKIIIDNSTDDAIDLIRNNAQKLKSQEIINTEINNKNNKKTKTEEKIAKQISQREKINILLEKASDEGLILKFKDLTENYNKISRKIEAIEGSKITQNLEKSIWVNNVYKNIYPSISAYADLVAIGADDEKSKEIISKAKESIGKQFDILNEHLLDIGQTFKEETISDRLKRIKLQEVITSKTLTNKM